MPGLVIQQVPGGAVKIVQGTTTQVVTAGLAQTSAGTFSPPSGTGFIHITGGAMDGAARNPLASEVPGFDGVTVTGVPANTWLVQATGAAAAVWVNPSTVTAGGVTPGTSGQIYITNSGPTAVWTSLISVDPATGSFSANRQSGANIYGDSLTAKYSGSIVATLGIYNSTVGSGVLYFGANAAAVASNNYTLYGDSTNTLLNAGTTVSFRVANTSYMTLQATGFALGAAVVASVDFTHGLATFGGNGSDQAVSIGPDPASPTTRSGIFFNKTGATAPTSIYSDQNSVVLQAIGGWSLQWAGGALQSTAGSFTLGTTVATRTVTLQADASASVIQLAGGSQNTKFNGTTTSLALGTHLATTGHWRMPETWSLTARDITNAADQTIIALDATGIVWLAPYTNGGAVYVGPGTSGGSVNIWGNPVSIQSFNGSGSFFITTINMAINWGAGLGGFAVWDVNNLAFHNLATTPILWQYAAATDVATVPLTIRAQYAYALATGTHQIPGSLVFDIGAPTNGGTTEAAFKFTRNGGSAFASFGVQNSIPTFGHLWLGTTAAASTNWALRSDASGSCYLNAEAGGATGLITGGSTFQLYIVGGVAYFGGSTAAAPLTHDWTTTTTPKMQSGTSATTLTIGTNKAGAVLGLQADAGTSVVSCDSAAVRIINVNFRVANSSQFGSLTESFGGGSGVIGIKDASVSPSSNPSGGGVLYSEAGALKWRGSSGSITTIATA